MDLQVVQVIHLQYRQRPLRVTMAATGLLEVHNSVEVEVEVLLLLALMALVVKAVMAGLEAPRQFQEYL